MIATNYNATGIATNYPPMGEEMRQCDRGHTPPKGGVFPLRSILSHSPHPLHPLFVATCRKLSHS